MTDIEVQAALAGVDLSDGTFSDRFRAWVQMSFSIHARDHYHCSYGDEPHFVPLGRGGYFLCDVALPLTTPYSQTRRLVVPGWETSEDIPDVATGTVYKLLTYPDRSMALQHECHVDSDALYVVASPLLRGRHGHHRLATETTTITPSIVCPTCDLHGFITRGEWWPACPPGQDVLDLTELWE
jgi:hypothetical protein